MTGGAFPVGLGPAPPAEGFLAALPRTRPGCRPVVLDAGFGDGRLRPQIVAGNAMWAGVELCPERVAAAHAAGFPAFCCDITQSLPFQRASIDGVILTYVLNLIPQRSQRRRLVAEVRRVTRPGGVVWIRDFERVNDGHDARIGTEVSRADWEAARRRHRFGRRLAVEVTGVPFDSLVPGSFPAFRVAPGFTECERFRSHRYSAGQFIRAVRRRQVIVDFLACHPTLRELRDEWSAIGTIENVEVAVGQARGGSKLPAMDLLVRT